MWITLSWPLAKEVTRPLSSDPLEMERVAAQEVFRESANRIQGSLEALFSRDYQTVAQHLLDGYLVLTHRMAESEARRWAAFTNSEALLQKREAIQRGAAGSSVTDIMYSLAKKQSTVDNFFHRGGSSGQPQTPSQFPTQSQPVSSNPIAFVLDQTTNRLVPTQVQPVGGTVQTYQPQQAWGRGKGRKNNRGG
jgi:hypothetical protein